MRDSFQKFHEYMVRIKRKVRRFKHRGKGKVSTRNMKTRNDFIIRR